MTVDDYIDSLPEERRIAIRAVREAVNAKLPPGFEEGIVYGMIAWFVPFTRLAETYNGQPLCVASLGAQKSHMALYLMSVYGDPALNDWFTKAWKATGKKLDMGKSCIRFRKLDEMALDVVTEAISRVGVDQFVAAYEKARENTAEGKAAAAKAAAAKVEETAKAVVAKAKTKVASAEGKAKAAAAKAGGKAKAVVASAKTKAKAVVANARTKAKAVVAKTKAKATASRSQASAKAKAAGASARGKLAATAARAKASAKTKKSRARA